MTIIAATVLVFLLQIFITKPVDLSRRDTGRAPTTQSTTRQTELDDEFGPFVFRESVIQKWLELDTQKVLHGQVWRVVTNAFCHDRWGIWHIAINMGLLFWFGRALELMYGRSEFALFYFAGAICAAVAFMLLDCVTGMKVPMIGASGAVMAVMTLYTLHFPGERYRIWYIGEVEMRWIMLIYAIYELHPVLLALAGDRYFAGVAHIAHLGGMAFGVAYWFTDIRLAAWKPGLRIPRVVQVRVTKPSRDRSGAPQETPSPVGRSRGRSYDSRELDAVLAKLSATGADSLTEEDRAVLETARRSLKKPRLFY
ncbi:MAG: rhomboid family intramembrane serine protease [Tepidisphaeraceae bacterium]